MLAGILRRLRLHVSIRAMSESATGRTGDGRLKDDGRLRYQVALVIGAARGQGAVADGGIMAT